MSFGLKPDAIGLSGAPRYLDSLALQPSVYYKEHNDLCGTSAGKAASLWRKTQMASIFQDYYDKTEALWGRRKEAYDAKQANEGDEEYLGST